MTALLEREAVAFLSDTVQEFEDRFEFELGDVELPAAADCLGGCDGTCSGGCASTCIGTQQW